MQVLYSAILPFVSNWKSIKSWTWNDYPYFSWFKFQHSKTIENLKSSRVLMFYSDINSLCLIRNLQCILCIIKTNINRSLALMPIICNIHSSVDEKYSTWCYAHLEKLCWTNMVKFFSLSLFQFDWQSWFCHPRQLADSRGKCLHRQRKQCRQC